MATQTLGTGSTTSLFAVTYNPPQGVGQGAASSLLMPADLASISAGIMGDSVAKVGGTGVRTTGNTHSGSMTIDGIASMTRIQLGMPILSARTQPGTFVVSVNVAGSSVVLSQPALSDGSGVTLLFAPISAGARGRLSFNGELEIPGRGVLQVFPGDVVAVGNAGEVILVPASAIAYVGSRWVLSA